MSESAGPARTDDGADLDVLVVVPGFPKDEEDDRCLPAIQEFLPALQANMPAVRLRVLSLHYPFSRGDRCWRGLPVMDIGGRNRRWPFRIFSLVEAFLGLADLVRQRRPTLIHTFLLTAAAFVASRFARSREIPCIGSLLGQDALASNRYIPRLSPMAGVVAPSDVAADAFRTNFGGDRPEVIPRGVEPFVGTLPSWETRTIDLLGVGSLVDLKDFSMLVRIVAELHREGRLHRAVLIGDGPERLRLQEEAAARGLGGVLDFRGSLSRRLVLETMADARVLLHPSRYEGFGMVFAEAQSRGMGIVSRAVGCATPGGGWSVGESESALTEFCRVRLRQRPETEQSACHPIDLTVFDYVALYQQVIASRVTRVHAS